MRIISVRSNNYRSLVDFSIAFPQDYSVISGRNNSGKSCILRLIRILIGGNNTSTLFHESPDFKWSEDVTQWVKPTQPSISASILLEFHKEDDPGAIEFISRISQKKYGSKILVKINYLVSSDDKRRQALEINDDAVNDDYAAREIIRWIQDSNCIVYHDSTSYAPSRSILRQEHELFSLTKEEKSRIEDINKRFSSAMKKIANAKKEKIESLLGSIGEKYQVDLDYPNFQWDTMPFEITLSERKGEEIRLENWGSGTRNRTLIFSSILRASQIASDASNNSRVKPVVVIEEPEAFLHPSAQSNFGRVLETIARDTKIQIVISSHSPFLLSHSTSKANFLLERETKRGKQYATQLIDTDGDEWLRPFSESLGMSSDELRPWHSIIASSSGNVLIVEGDIDYEYLNIFKTKAGGISDSIEIRPIGGKDKLTDKQMVKFIHKFAKRVVFLLDLDAQKMEASFLSIGMERGKDFIFAGKDMPGKRRIEGLLPEEVTHAVHITNHDLVSQLQSDANDEKRLAQSTLKKKYLAQFKLFVDRGGKSPDFDRLVQLINRAFT